MQGVTDINAKRKKRRGAIKRFLNKSGSELTIGDTLLITAGTVAITVTVPLVIEGWSYILARGYLRVAGKGSQETHGL